MYRMVGEGQDKGRHDKKTRQDKRRGDLQRTCARYVG